MTNASKAKGTYHETRVVDFLKRAGFPVVRPAQRGKDDIGDVWGVPDWTIEAKNVRGQALASAMDEARRESAKADTSWFCVWKHRDRAQTERDYVIMEAGQFCQLLLKLT